MAKKKKRYNKTLIRLLKDVEDLQFNWDGPYAYADENYATFEFHMKKKPIRVTVNMIEPYRKKSNHKFFKSGKKVKIKRRKKHGRRTNKN